jgi:hypothetical protein
MYTEVSKRAQVFVVGQLIQKQDFIEDLLTSMGKKIA